MSLQRLVLDFRSGELVVRCLYRSQDGPNPQTKARRREVEDLARSGLELALEGLQASPAEIVGTSGFTTREDLLCITAPAVHKKLKRGA